MLHVFSTNLCGTNVCVQHNVQNIPLQSWALYIQYVFSSFKQQKSVHQMYCILIVHCVQDTCTVNMVNMCSAYETVKYMCSAHLNSAYVFTTCIMHLWTVYFCSGCVPTVCSAHSYCTVHTLCIQHIYLYSTSCAHSTHTFSTWNSKIHEFSMT